MRSKKADLVATLLRELAKKIEVLGDEDIEGILSGHGHLELRIVPTWERSRTAKRTQLTRDELKEAGESLFVMRTREEGEKYLKEHFKTKEDLVLLAKVIDIPTQKKYTVTQVIERIIEGTIGFRIRSAAIQGGDSSAKSK